jgi:hypothetical protein
MVGRAGGFEFRSSLHFAIINEFSWTVLDGPRDEFGMIRSAIRFAF